MGGHKGDGITVPATGLRHVDEGLIEALVIADYNPKFADGEIMDLWLGLNGRVETELDGVAKALNRAPITTASINVNQFWIFAANLITLAAMRVAAEYTKPEDNWADPMETKDAD